MRCVIGPPSCDECGQQRNCEMFQKVTSLKRCLSIERVSRTVIKEEFQSLHTKLDVAYLNIFKSVGECPNETV